MDVKVYSTPSCPWCHRTKEFLREKSVEFKDIDVSSDDAAAKEMTDLSGQRGVPVTVIGEHVIVGFDRDALENALEHGEEKAA